MRCQYRIFITEAAQREERRVSTPDDQGHPQTPLKIDRLPARPAHHDSKKESRPAVEKSRKKSRKKRERERVSRVSRKRGRALAGAVAERGQPFWKFEEGCGFEAVLFHLVWASLISFSDHPRKTVIKSARVISHPLPHLGFPPPPTPALADPRKLPFRGPLHTNRIPVKPVSRPFPSPQHPSPPASHSCVVILFFVWI